MKEKNKKLIEKQSNKKGARLFEAWKKIGASETLIAVSKRLTRTMMMLLWYGVNSDRGKSHMKRQVGNVYTKMMEATYQHKPESDGKRREMCDR